MARQGSSLSAESVRKIILLLSSTDMTVAEIAERMSCTKNTVAAINRRFQVRIYNGLRSSWSKSNLDMTKVDESLTEGMATKRSA